MTTALTASSEMAELVHDLRSPLAAIEAAAHAILGMGGFEPAVCRMIDLVAQEARSAQLLVDSALSGAGHASSCPIAPVLTLVATRAAVRWSAEVQVSGEGLLAGAHGDEVDIGRAVSNLVDNAFQHGECQDVRIEAVVRGAWVVIRVSGANHSDHENGVHASHGIGLQSVRRLVEYSGGHYEIFQIDGVRVDELHLPLALDPAEST